MFVKTFIFPNNKQALAVYTSGQSDGQTLMRMLNLPPPRAVLLLHGGASDMEPVIIARVRHLINEIAYVVAEENITVIDGGTRAGVMAMMGEAHAAAGARSPLIGVCPAGLIPLPGEPAGPGQTPLEPNHTHFVLTPGDRWGDETEMMFVLAAALSSQCPSVAILINGGVVSLQEMLYNVSQRREIIVFENSGRLADVIASARKGVITPPDEQIAAIAREGQFTLFDVIYQEPMELATLIRQKLFWR